ncbi:histidine phosphatase family protein [Microbulbifer sediminum]|uniref:histidine phosphatase family protein n=1 Tax=Microbulbifer sediminum TaxID=2904250 RepID=UPI001F3F2336|nr:histidine phosphatase family protein [Microbulbifer sediminum]
MAEFFTVRHGQASFGAADYDKLSELGWRQARWLGEHWMDLGAGFDRILCGDLLRHRETARGICEGAGLDHSRVEVLSQLNEFDFQAVMHTYGELDPGAVPGTGAGRSDYYRFLKKAMRAWIRADIHPGETWVEFEQRVSEALAILADSPRGSRTLVVSSGGAIAMMVRTVMEAGPEAVIKLNMQIRNTAVSHFFASPDNISLHSFNHIPHLEHRERREFITYS